MSGLGEGSGSIRFGGGWSAGRISSHRAEIHVPTWSPDGEGQMESAVRIPPRLMSGRDRHVRAISCAGSILLGPFVGPAPHWAWLGPLQARGGAEILPCPSRLGCAALLQPWMACRVGTNKVNTGRRNATGSQGRRSRGRASRKQTRQLFRGWLEEGLSAHRHLSWPPPPPSPLGTEAWNSAIKGSFLWLGIQTSQ